MSPLLASSIQKHTQYSLSSFLKAKQTGLHIFLLLLLLLFVQEMSFFVLFSWPGKKANEGRFVLQRPPLVAQFSMGKKVQGKVSIVTKQKVNAVIAGHQGPSLLLRSSFSYFTIIKF